MEPGTQSSNDQASHKVEVLFPWSTLELLKLRHISESLGFCSGAQEGAFPASSQVLLLLLLVRGPHSEKYCSPACELVDSLTLEEEGVPEGHSMHGSALDRLNINYACAIDESLENCWKLEKECLAPSQPGRKYRVIIIVIIGLASSR